MKYSSANKKKLPIQWIHVHVCTMPYIYIAIVCVFFFHPPLSLFRLLASPPNTNMRAQNFSIQRYTLDLHNWTYNFDFTVQSEYVDLDERTFYCRNNGEMNQCKRFQIYYNFNKQSFRSSFPALQIRVLNV